jgi:hypothetical protein
VQSCADTFSQRVDPKRLRENFGSITKHIGGEAAGHHQERRRLTALGAHPVAKFGPGSIWQMLIRQDKRPVIA